MIIEFLFKEEEKKITKKTEVFTLGLKNQGRTKSPEPQSGVSCKRNVTAKWPSALGSPCPPHSPYRGGEGPATSRVGSEDGWGWWGEAGRDLMAAQRQPNRPMGQLWGFLMVSGRQGQGSGSGTARTAKATREEIIIIGADA